MAKGHRTTRANTNPSDPPDPDTSQRPTHSTAGKGGHLAQLQRVAHAIEMPRRSSRQAVREGALTNEPVNLMAPTPRCQTRRKKDGKQGEMDANVMQVDPTHAIQQSLPDRTTPHGQFGLQPQATFVGTQTAQDYNIPQGSTGHSGSDDLFNSPLSVIYSQGDQDKVPDTHVDDYEMLYTDGVDLGRVPDQEVDRARTPQPDYDMEGEGQGDGHDDKDSDPQDEDDSNRDEDDTSSHGGHRGKNSGKNQDNGEDEDRQDIYDDEDRQGHDNEDEGDRLRFNRHRSQYPPPSHHSHSNAKVPVMANGASDNVELRGECSKHVAVRRGNELPDIDYDLVDCHHLTNPQHKSPSPTFLARVRRGDCEDDCGSKRMRLSDKRSDGETIQTTVQRGRDASAVALRPREVSGPVPQPRSNTAVAPRSCEGDRVVQSTREGATTVLRVHEGAPAIPRLHNTTAASRCNGGPRNVLQSRENAPTVPRHREDACSISRHREDACDVPMGVPAVPEARQGASRSVNGAQRMAANTAAAAGPEQAQRHGRYSKNPKGSTPAQAYTISFYPPLWTELLETAKAEVCLSLFKGYPFLRVPAAITGHCSEILFEIVADYERGGKQLEAGYWDEHKHGMARLLFYDTQTFRSEIKKSAQDIIPVAYNLVAPENMTSQSGRLEFIKCRAAALIQESQYLKGAPDEAGHSSPFANPALKSICHTVFYRNSSKSLRNFPLFQKSILKTAVTLVAAYVHTLLTVWRENGCNNRQPLNSGTVEGTYKKLLGNIEKVSKHAYYGPKLEDTLVEWAQSGLVGFVTQVDDGSDGDEFGGNISDFDDFGDMENE